jgi:hypothetical protein
VLHVWGVHGSNEIFEESLSSGLSSPVPDLIHHLFEFSYAQVFYSFTFTMDFSVINRLLFFLLLNFQKHALDLKFLLVGR